MNHGLLTSIAGNCCNLPVSMTVSRNPRLRYFLIPSTRSGQSNSIKKA
jgi:hypothetical protein